MTPPLPPHQPQTAFGRVKTQVVQNLQSFTKLALQPQARVPKLLVWEAGEKQPKPPIPLLGDYYTLGRSSQSHIILGRVPDPIVSGTHLILSRDSSRRSPFVVEDQSSNGVFIGKRRLKKPLPLRHGDIITLGPPEETRAVRIQYLDPPPWYVLTLRYSLYGIGGIMGLVLLWISIEWLKSPEVHPLPPSTQGPIVVYSDDDSTPLFPPRTQAHRDLKNLADFSPYLSKAVIASEDSRFYWHLGVDPLGILRALVTNISGGAKQGGSTVTQQLARSLFPYVGNKNSGGRKLREAVMALKLEAFYSKDDILLNYLNRVFLGQGAIGFEEAAQFYFGKSAKDLNVSEAATLVGILPEPNNFNPMKNYKKAEYYRNRVIERMAAQGAITTEESNRARRSLIEISPKAKDSLSFKDTKAPYFYSYVFQELRQVVSEKFANEGSLIIETGLNLDTQKKAETALKTAVNTSGASNRFSQGAMVTLNSSTGEIIALVGGVDYQQSQFNRATDAKRQPGSTFKIFTYTSAIEQGISPGKIYSCAPLIWQGQRFKACERASGTSIDLATGVALSENAIALRVAQDVGLSKVVAMARKLGIKSDLQEVPGLVLGQSVTTVLEMTGAFGTLSNNGIYRSPHAIKRILDSSDCEDYKNPKTCRVIYSFDKNSDPNVNKRVLSADVADTMTDIFRGVVQRGTGKNAALGLGEAGKTGTTNDNKDLWFIGYIPRRQIVTGIWLGNDTPTPTNGSGAVAAQLWGNYMRRVVR